MHQLNCVIKSNCKAIEAETFVAGNELKIDGKKFCLMETPVCILYRHFLYSIHIFYTLDLSYICHFNRAFCQNLFAAQTKEKEEFTCPSHIANGNYADPATCRRFYQVSSPLPLYLFYSIAHSNWANCCGAKVKHFEPTLSVQQSRAQSFRPTAIRTISLTHSLHLSVSLSLSFHVTVRRWFPVLESLPVGSLLRRFAEVLHVQGWSQVRPLANK